MPSDDADRSEYDLALDALEGSVLRMVRQGQRVILDLDEQGLAVHLRLGSEGTLVHLIGSQLRGRRVIRCWGFAPS